jgi:glycosyltransferase involved in cell wall biosynthesis
LAKASTDYNIRLLVTKNTEKDFNEVLEEYFDLEPIKNFKIEFISNHGLLDRVTKFYLESFNRIRRLAKEGKVEAVITRKVGFLPYLYLLKRLYNIKVFFEVHDFYFDLKLKGERSNIKKSLFERWFLPKVDGVVCHQSQLIKLYKRYMPDQNYCLARTGIKEVIKNPNLWKNKYLGYVGSLDKRKRVEDIFQALNKISDDSLKLLIIGGKSQKVIDKYLALAKCLGIEDRVEVTGWISRNDLEKRLKEIKIGITPLADTFFNRYLTSPMKIFNYFSHGIPVISTDLPAPREIITEKGGIFYENGDIDGLVEAINQLNLSKEIFDSYSNYIIEKSEELLWEKRGEKIIEFIKNF